MKWWPEKCEPGDMVRVRVGSVYHYGVFVSEQEIIQFGPPPTGEALARGDDFDVCAATAEAFSNGQIIERAVLDRSERRKRVPPEQTVALARSRLGEKGYSLLHNNCEHFAYECVLGVKRSTQEEDIRRRWSSRPILDVYVAPMPETVEELPIASPERQAEIDGTPNPELRAARRYDWQVLLYAADRSMGLKADDLRFQKDSRGKWSCDQFWFSLSHTKGAVAVAVSNGKVGVDIENALAREHNAFFSEKRPGIFRRIATRRERQTLSEGDTLDLWLKKESIYKAFGRTKTPVEVESGDYGAEVYCLPELPEHRFAVCGEKLQSARFFLYENGSARTVSSRITKSGSAP